MDTSELPLGFCGALSPSQLVFLDYFRAELCGASSALPLPPRRLSCATSWGILSLCSAGPAGTAGLCRGLSWHRAPAASWAQGLGLGPGCSSLGQPAQPGLQPLAQPLGLLIYTSLFSGPAFDHSCSKRDFFFWREVNPKSTQRRGLVRMRQVVALEEAFSMLIHGLWDQKSQFLSA